ncbi:hypothetical protein K0M31_001488 [Melipona bicolor]|uniref:Uncharacterized protein n=1 Tax=Melipona bicolor TaxID=60889 RepID=A0AA40GGT7_9HYME|nr:hypothetical protein K0M31_001488 [Melipona bicolor]
MVVLLTAGVKLKNKLTFGRENAVAAVAGSGGVDSGGPVKLLMFERQDQTYLKKEEEEEEEKPYPLITKITQTLNEAATKVALEDQGNKKGLFSQECEKLELRSGTEVKKEALDLENWTEEEGRDLSLESNKLERN